MIRRIHVIYSLRVEPDVDEAKVQRAFDNHMPKCPVYRSIEAAIDVTTELQLVRA